MRARAVCGNPNLSKAILEFAGKFSFRSHLDYSIREGLKNLRRNIFAETPSKFRICKLKASSGGIRDIDSHALMVVYGGRNKDLEPDLRKVPSKNWHCMAPLPKQTPNFLQIFTGA